MKFTLFCLVLTGICDAGFVIQKMGPEQPERKSINSRLSTGSHGLINAVSINGKSMNKNARTSRKTTVNGNNKSFRGSVSGAWPSSVNVISSVGAAKNDFKVIKDNRKSYQTGRPLTLAPINSNYLRLSVNSNNNNNKDKDNNKDRKSRKSLRKSKVQTQKEPKKSSKSTKSSKSIKSSSKSIKLQKNLTLDGFVYVSLPLNQWTEFYFSEVGQLPYSRWTFDIPADQKCTLQVTDAYCTGDRFEATRLLDNGVEVPLLSTPPVMFNPVIAEQIRQGSNVTCNPFTTDPATAWSSPDWSKGEVTLAPGNYKLILKSLLAPYGSGGAYVRLSCKSRCSNTVTTTATTTTTTTAPSSQNVCTYGSSGIKYIRQTLPFTQQANVCYAYGLRPLDVTTSNIRDARTVLMNCAGVGTRAWIASYNGDNYRGIVGLSLHATQLSEVGAISASPDSSPLEGVLCQ